MAYYDTLEKAREAYKLERSRQDFEGVPVDDLPALARSRPVRPKEKYQIVSLIYAQNNGLDIIDASAVFA